jgi:hypothetical protein
MLGQNKQYNNEQHAVSTKDDLKTGQYVQFEQ